MRVIVTGGRHYADKDFVFKSLSSISPKPTRIIQGGATGADALARAWAKENRVQCVTYHADWALPNFSGGPIRNSAMAFDGADLCYAFDGGTGTSNMLKMAKKAGIKTGGKHDL